MQNSERQKYQLNSIIKMVKRFAHIVILLLIFNCCYSQIITQDNDTFVLDIDTIFGKGKSLEGHNIGNWEYCYRGGKFACRAYYLIDTNTVSLTTRAKQELQRYLSSVSLDSLLVSYENFNEYYDSTHWIIVKVFQPNILYNRQEKILSNIIREQGEYRSVYYQNSGIIESSSSIKNGFENGFQYIYNTSGQLQVLNYNIYGQNQYRIRNNYDDNGNLLSSIIEYENLPSSTNIDIRQLWPYSP